MKTTHRIIVGDVLDGLRSMEAGSCRCCVTSPPYWGLRDYGTASWVGGDAACDHKERNARNDGNRQGVDGFGGNANKDGHADMGAKQYRIVCGKCGARRVDQQIGLESTPDEYVARIVAVFREVRRVLADDGTCWINLAGSYASGGMQPSQSPLLQSVRSCGTDGTEQQGSPETGFGCCDQCGGHRASLLSRNSDSILRRGTSAADLSTATCSDAQQDLRPTPLVASLPAGRRSTKRQSSRQLPDASGLEAMASACQQERQTSSPGAGPSAHTTACTCGTSRMSQPLVVRTEGKESFFSACGRSDCNGIGRCGLCWCSLAIPSLNIKQKDEVNIAHLVAMALQADGWVLRQTIVWHKPGPMPESVTDRCTKAHEYVFLLSKSPRYYCDMEAIAEAASNDSGFAKQRMSGVDTWKYGRAAGGTGVDNHNGIGGTSGNGTTRNARSVWTIGTQPFPEAHFATFPEELPRRCIKAGSSEKGKCPACGKPWVRVDDGNAWAAAVGQTKWTWKPTCECGGDPVPDVVLDPFVGSGTTLAVARSLGRNGIGCELNPDYAAMAEDRIGRTVKPSTHVSKRDEPAPLFGGAEE